MRKVGSKYYICFEENECKNPECKMSAIVSRLQYLVMLFIHKICHFVHRKLLRVNTKWLSARTEQIFFNYQYPAGTSIDTLTHQPQGNYIRCLYNTPCSKGAFHATITSISCGNVEVFEYIRQKMKYAWECDWRLKFHSQKRSAHSSDWAWWWDYRLTFNIRRIKSQNSNVCSSV